MKEIRSLLQEGPCEFVVQNFRDIPEFKINEDEGPDFVAVAIEHNGEVYVDSCIIEGDIDSSIVGEFATFKLNTEEGAGGFPIIGPSKTQE